MKPSDWRQFSALLALIRQGKGLGPSFAEIGAAWGTTSKGKVSRDMDRLEDAWLIRRLRGRKRAIEVTRFLVPCDGSNGAVLLPGAGG